MSDLLILRHGPTLWNAEKRMQGRSDIPLSPEGRVTVRKWRLPEAWYNVRWIVSPLTRAQQTARIMGQDNFDSDPLLIEMSWGEWEGQRLPELRKKLGSKMQEMEDLGLDLLPPGGESPRQVQMRLLPFLQKLAKQDTSVVSVAHKGILRALYASATNWNMLGKPQEKILNDCAHLFKIRKNGQVELSRVNLSLVESMQDFPEPAKIPKTPTKNIICSKEGKK